MNVGLKLFLAAFCMGVALRMLIEISNEYYDLKDLKDFYSERYNELMKEKLSRSTDD